MKTKNGVLMFILFAWSNILFAQNIKPAFRSASGTYYFTHPKPIVLKWGDTKFFSDTTARRSNPADTTRSFSINAVTEVKSATDMSVYPNPFMDVIHIKYDKAGDLQVELLDVAGKYSMRKMLSGGNRQLDLTGLASSTYFLKVYDSSGSSLLQTFKIEKVN